MTRGRKKSRLSIIYISEANRPTRRAESSRYLLYLIMTVIALTILALILWQYHTHSLSADQISKLNTQLDSEQMQFRQMVDDKNQTIESLQVDILDLSEQTKKVNQQLQDLKVLESELKSLANKKPEFSALNTAYVKSSRGEVESLSVGGEANPPTDDQVQELIEGTKSSIVSLEANIKNLAKSFTDVKSSLIEQEKIARRTPDLWPTGSRAISSGYGIRGDPFTRKLTFHSGLDIAGNRNDSIIATADGVIETTGWSSGKGNYILIDHTHGLETLYMHLNKILISEGQTVEKGEKIGLMGSTGRSTGNHLHYEVHKYGKIVNPINYLP